ncbi:MULTISPECIES: glycosyltransferase family 4 protein [Tenacibaculum]|uniref:glycosyltransferase family 4 protein n=1 Tax=Tenacibaculum TaxID=104267 RepID=UPI001F0AB455|nr:MULTISPECIES: glycosyltransferase family 4 protein [Tenacibaculum]MCH3883139.1 glycosyltransferase family 4 protein [Tenacibaculum aquimarinum]MDO6600877.1 glycosyltransferase family 4 protein [Tenacibaculum sp. 1_MG-2023]
MKKKLIRITTVPLSLEKLLENQLKFMKEYYDITAISAEKERLERFGVDQEVKTYYLELTRQITPLKDFKALYKLYKFLKREKPFIVHTHTPKAGLIGMLASYFAKTPNRLHTIAGLPLLQMSGVKKQIVNLTEKITFGCATKVYPNSFELQKIVNKLKLVNPKKSEVIANGSSNGIDTGYFNPNNYSEVSKKELKKQLGINENDVVFIFVGRIVGDKGINELVKSFNTLSLEENNIKLLLVGPLETELDPLEEITLHNIKSNKSIISVGYQKDVRPYFSVSNVLAFPSYREGFPNVVLQAGAMKLPSIVSNINGCNEIIVQDVNGLIIPVKNSEALYKAMKQLLLNKDLITNFSKKSRELVKEKYERRVVWEALLKEYRKLEELKA